MRHDRRCFPQARRAGQSVGVQAGTYRGIPSCIPAFIPPFTPPFTPGSGIFHTGFHTGSTATGGIRILLVTDVNAGWGLRARARAWDHREPGPAGRYVLPASAPADAPADAPAVHLQSSADAPAAIVCTGCSMPSRFTMEGFMVSMVGTGDLELAGKPRPTARFGVTRSLSVNRIPMTSSSGARVVVAGPARVRLVLVTTVIQDNRIWFA